MTYPIARLIDAPDPSATVRYDFNDVGTPTEPALAPRGVLADSFTLGAPSLDTPFDAVSPMYGPRSLGFTHTIKGLQVDADAAVALLSRELLRSSSWFLFQRTAFSRPSYWRLYVTGPAALGYDQVFVETATGDPVTVPSTWRIPVNLTAENFGYGERITHGPYTVTQAPDGDNPMRIVLPTIHGDAPTGLRVTITPDSTAGGDASRGTSWLLGCVSGTVAMADPVVEIGTADGFTGGTVASANPTQYFGDSYRTFSIGAGPGTLETILAGELPNVPVGRYKILVRCELDGSDSATKVINFRLTTIASLGAGPFFYGPIVPASVEVAGTPNISRGWVDLGEINLPPGNAVTSDPIVGQAAPSAEIVGIFKLDVGIPDGSASTLRLDAFKLIPIQGPDVSGATFIASRWDAAYLPGYVAAGPATAAGTWDADTALFWLTMSGSQNGLVSSTPILKGGFPVADPAAAQNVLYAIATDHGVGFTSSATTTISSRDSQVDVEVSYHPRLLHLDGRP